ncbi:MAG: thiamine pyrophosphate-dependent dehydrogenase E1 component subunit alpha [bacterium]|nr:thiamine pyrophosphate-dependent dehydrogenase E1 component subunit alpha [bacterium]
MTRVDDETLIRLYRTVLELRQAEITLAELYKEQMMRTPTHFGVGQEAVAAGVCVALQKSDLIYSHHRGHNHYLAKGGSLDGLVAELYGKETGCSRGRGGSVHLTDLSAGVVITTAILSQTIAVAAGTALAFKMDEDSRVVAVFFGDASLEEGGFYEAINYAAVKSLPVVFVCENNLYSTESPVGVRQAPGTSLCERVRSFKVEAHELDGNDVFAVHEAALAAAQRCRMGQGPVFLECMTYRWLEHVGPNYDHELGRAYRTREELESWQERCPVRRAGERLVKDGLAKPEELQLWLDEANAVIQSAVARAKDAPFPNPVDLFDYVY